MMGHALLAAPDAAATPALTNDDIAYIQLLEQANIGPATGYSYYDLALGGRLIANDVRRGVPPLTLANQVYYKSDLNWYQTKYEVAAAVVAYAPELLPPSIGAPAPGSSPEAGGC